MGGKDDIEKFAIKATISPSEIMYVLFKVMGILGFEIANNLDIFGQHLQNNKEAHERRIAGSGAGWWRVERRSGLVRFSLPWAWDSHYLTPPVTCARYQLQSQRLQTHTHQKQTLPEPKTAQMLAGLQYSGKKNFLSVSSFLTNLIISMWVLDNTFMVWDSVSKKGRRDGRDKGRREGKKETY